MINKLLRPDDLVELDLYERKHVRLAAGFGFVAGVFSLSLVVAITATVLRSLGWPTCQ